MHMTLDYRIVGPGMFMTATSYGLGRYAYGLFIPTFRDAFSLTDTRLALIASFSYGVLSCLDGSFYARVNLSDFDVCRLRSCVRPFDAVDNTAGLDEVRALGPNQISELVSPDSASGCPNFSSF